MVGGAFVFNASEVSRSILGATPSVVDPSQKINELFDKIIIDAGHKPFTSVSVQAQKKVSPVVTDFLQLAKVITQMPSKDNNELRELQKVLSGFDPKMKDYLIVGGSSKPNPKYADAMTAFQTYLNIDKTGKLNQETLDALRVKWNATQSTSLDAVPAVVAAPEPKVGRPYVPPPRRTEETPKSDVMSTEDQWAEILNGCVAQELRSAQLLKQNYDPSYLNNVNEILQNVRDLQGQGTPGLPRARQFLISAELLLTKIELQVRINDDYNTRKYDDFDTNAYDHTVLTNINNTLQTAYTRITQRKLPEARRLLEKVAADLDDLEGSVKKSVVAKPDGAIASEPTVEAGATPASVETSALNPAELESRRQLLLGRAKAVLGDSNTIQDNRVFVREANRSLADGKDVQKALNKNDLTEANRILDVAEWSIYYTELNTRTNVLRNEGLLIDSWDATNPIFYNLGLYEIGGGNRDQPFAIVKLKLDESNAAITQFERNAAVDKYNEANIAFGKLTASTDNVIQEKIIKLHSEIANLQDLLDSKLPQNYIQLYWRAKKDLDEANSIAASVASVAKSEAPVVNLAEKTSEPIEGSVKAKFEELTRLLTEAQRANEQAGKNNWTKLDVESQKSLSHEASTFLSHNQFAEADGKITAAIDSFPRIYLTAAQTAHANSNTIYTDFGPRNGIDKKYQKEYDSLGNELGEFSSQFLDNVSDLSSAVIAYQKSVDLYSRILAFNEKTHAPIDAPVVSKRTTVNFKDSETGFTPASGAEEKPAELDFDSSVVDSLSLSRRADEQQARINKLNDANPRLRDSLSTINNSLNQENTGVYALIKGGTPIQLNEADAKLNDVTNALDNLEASSSANLSKSIIVVIADMDRLKAAGLGYEDMGKNRKILVDLNEVVLKGNPTPKETGLIQFINNDFARIVKIIADDQKVAAENLVATAPNKADLLKLAVEASDDTTRAIEYNRVANAVKPAVSVEVILPTGTLLESINYIRDTINEMGTTGYDQAVLQKQLEQLNDIARKLPKKATQSQQLKSMGGLETIADNLNIEIKKQQQYAMTSRILAKDVYDSTDNEDQKTKASAFLDSAARFMKDGSYPKASAEYETARVFLYATLRASSSNLSISKPIAESVVTAESITDDFKKLNERVTGMKDSGYGKMQDVSELIGSMQNNLNNNTLKKNGIYLFETTVAIANINTYLDSVVEQRKAADISFVTLMKKIGTDGAIIKNPVLNLKTSGQQLYVQQKYRQAKQKYDEALVALQTTLVPTVGLRSPVIPESDYYSQVRFSTKAVAVYIGTLNPTAVVTATLTPNATVNFRDMLKDESTRVLFTAVEVTNEETRYTLIPAGLSISRKDAIKLEHTTVLEGDGIFIFLKDGGVVDAQQNNKSPLPSDVAKVKIGSYTQGRDGSIRINWDSIDKRYDQYVLGTITGNDIIDQLDKSKKYVLPQDTKISFIVSTYKGIHSNPRSRYIWQVGMQ